MKADVIQFSYWNAELRKIALWIERETGVEWTITSPYRMDDLGCHGQLPLRAFDLRIRLESMGEVLADHINKYWQYDPTRTQKKCALLHGEGANLHLHIQVHPNTKRLLP